MADQLEILKITQEVGDVEKFKDHYKYLKENFKSESEVKQIEDFVGNMLKEFTEKMENRQHFQKSEVKTFNFALQDIGKKIGSIA
ncbi:MAG: hypothetical protein LBH32_14460 [Dysgonamonadaceae bacterium]|nr:hypothetical protein [Dysgonamonadaceae bacterium]